jgi:hypothetical protein
MSANSIGSCSGNQKKVTARVAVTILEALGRGDVAHKIDPPPPLGTTDRTRYVKLTTLEAAQGPEMHTWIEQAGRVPGWK